MLHFFHYFVDVQITLQVILVVIEVFLLFVGFESIPDAAEDLHIDWMIEIGIANQLVIFRYWL
jgi:hypothetical protein